MEKDAVERRLKSASIRLADREPETDLALRRAMHFHLGPPALHEHGADRAGRQLRRIAIAAEMTEDDALKFSAEQLFDHRRGRGVREMTMSRLDPLLDRPWPMRIGLQHFFVMIRLDHERMHFAQTLDDHFRGVPKIGDEPERALAGMKRVSDRIDRVVPDRKRLNVDISDVEIRAGLEEPPVLVFA